MPVRPSRRARHAHIRRVRSTTTTRLHARRPRHSRYTLDRSPRPTRDALRDQHERCCCCVCVFFVSVFFVTARDGVANHDASVTSCVAAHDATARRQLLQWDHRVLCASVPASVHADGSAAAVDERSARSDWRHARRRRATSGLICVVSIALARAHPRAASCVQAPARGIVALQVRLAHAQRVQSHDGAAQGDVPQAARVALCRRDHEDLVRPTGVSLSTNECFMR